MKKHVTVNVSTHIALLNITILQHCEKETGTRQCIFWTHSLPAWVVWAHSDEHVKDERSQVRLVHYCLSCGQQAPFQLGDSLKGTPTIHPLCPASCLCCQDTRVPKILHLEKDKQKRHFSLGHYQSTLSGSIYSIIQVTRQHTSSKLKGPLLSLSALPKYHSFSLSLFMSGEASSTLLCRKKPKKNPSKWHSRQNDFNTWVKVNSKKQW